MRLLALAVSDNVTDPLVVLDLEFILSVRPAIRVSAPDRVPGQQHCMHPLIWIITKITLPSAAADHINWTDNVPPKTHHHCVSIHRLTLCQSERESRALQAFTGNYT